MKKMVKVILAAAAVVALAVPAMAVDKLIVKNGSNAEVFKVDDAGTILGAKAGFGTTNPRTPFHLHLPNGTGGITDAGTSGMYSVSAGMAMSAQTNSASAAFVVADNSGPTGAGYRGSVAGVRAGGTLLVPTAPAVDDLVFSIIGGIWDGGAIRNTADINFTVDGAVSTNVAPQRISFRTRTGGAGGYIERLTIKNDGKIIMGSLPTYADNAAAVSLAVGTLYKTSTGVVMIRY